MDQLSQIINRFSIQAGVFYTGKLCGLSSFEEHSIEGHIHILKSGRLKISSQNDRDITLSEPSIVFFPRHKSHKLTATESDNAEVICATVQYGIGNINPVAMALPDIIVIPFTEAKDLSSNLEWILSEALGQKLGKQTILNRLMEIFIISMLRYLIEKEKIEQGILAGMAHPRLNKVLEAIHSSPDHNWTIERLADIAMMSRAKFSPLFKQVIGSTPNDYLTHWRVCLAQQLLLQGKNIGVVANEVGYESPSTLSRAFIKICQLSPSAWLKNALL